MNSGISRLQAWRGFNLTPAIAIGRMGFFVISFGIHFKQRIGFGIVIPIFPIWG
jgi:hypothetical protein